ncbi:MAG: phosphatidylglycerophosphatase A [Rhodospirillales bacterium]|nr:phosphatidylglycerophosphatase A [Rhodospirillales bacterium]
MSDEHPRLDLKQPYVWLATWFGCGLIKHAPGTWGSLGALPFGIILYTLSGLWGLTLGILLVSLIGYWASARFEKASATHDNKMIVIDEVAGQWIALFPAFFYWNLNPVAIAAAFLLFRLFDVTKPWPISYIDKQIGGALGVMLDDSLAGIAAALCLIGAFHAGLG